MDWSGLVWILLRSLVQLEHLAVLITVTTTTSISVAEAICDQPLLPVEYYLGVKVQPDGKREGNDKNENKRSPEYQKITTSHPQNCHTDAALT